jgi:hypothetical protein
MVTRKRRVPQDATQPNSARYGKAELKAIMELIESFEMRLARSRHLHTSIIHLGLTDAWSLRLMIELLKKEAGIWPPIPTSD